jgi:hypothetical protein
MKTPSAVTEIERRARYLLNISVFLRDVEKYDGVRRQAQELLAEAERLKKPVDSN